MGIVSDAMIADNVLLDPLMIAICPENCGGHRCGRFGARHRMLHKQ